ncbi:MAG: recombinase family protein [Microbacteriaceae bacterium]|nr:recombinase family protein [Microbacteriaceae bacterium]
MYSKRCTLTGMENSPARLVGYIRVSTEEQCSTGVSLQAQRERLEAYVSLYDGVLVDVVADAGVSAKTLRRPGLTQALAALDEGRADGIVVAKLDRLTRSVRDLGELLDRYFRSERCSLLSVAEQIDTRSAGGRLVLHVLASVSEWERDAISERTRAALEHLRNKGVRLGGTPFGLRRIESGDGSVLDDAADEQSVIDEMVVLRNEGYTLREIAEHLTRAGRRTKRGRRWHASTVRGILQRAA